MNNTALPTKSAAKSRLPKSVPSTGPFRTPLFECETLPDAFQLVVYLPEVHPRDVEIATRGTDLTVSARKAHHVRANWKSMHLEGVQRDYLLSLRLGRALNFAALQAQLRDGILTLTIPKQNGDVIGFRPESHLVA